jgi:Phasin protein
MAVRSNDGRYDYGFPALMAPLGFESWMDMSRPALTALADLNVRVYENLAAMNKEWTGYIDRRLKEDLAMPQQIASCKSVPEMYGVYFEYFQKAVAHYQEELEQLARLTKTLADDAIHTVQTRIEDAAREQRRRA